MKRYQSHKVVEAAPIVGVNVAVSLVIVEGENGREEIYVPEHFFARSIPEIDDYLVKYLPDGYLSWSPKEIFEDGYTLLG